MRGRAKQRKMSAHFRARWWVRIGRAFRRVARAVRETLAPAFDRLRRALTCEPRRDDYTLTAGPGGES